MLCKMPRPNEDISPSHGVSTTVSPSFTIPPHVMGRTVHNPTIDTTGPGRRPQKPRPGMRVPYRNLSSQIVTQDEIAQEILNRQMKRNSVSQPRVLLVDNVKGRSLNFGASGETTFAQCLSQKLANQLSSQADVENKSTNGSIGILRPQETSEQSQHANSCGCHPSREKLSAEIIHSDSNGIDVAVISPTKPSISPRMNSHKTSKLDKEAEKEMALKQLKELPMIKDSESAVRRKNLLKSDTSMQLCPINRNLTTPSDLKSCVKIETKVSCNSEEKHSVNTSSDNSSNMRQTLPSSQESVLVQFQNSKLNYIRHPVLSGTRSRPKKSSENFFNKTKLIKKRILKSSLPNGQCEKLQKEIDIKRRSARLSDKDVLYFVKRKKKSKKESSLPPGNEMNQLKRKRPKGEMQNAYQSTSCSNIPPVINMEASNATDVEPSPKKLCTNDDDTSDQNVLDTRSCQYTVPTPQAVKIESSCALNTPVSLKEIQSQADVKETKVDDSSASLKQSKPKLERPVKKYAGEVEKLFKDEGAFAMLLDVKDLKGTESEVREKRQSKEVEKLFSDEGVVNMILETSPLGLRMVKKKLGRPATKEFGRTSKETILYKASLARKTVIMNSSLPSRLRHNAFFKRKKELERQQKVAERKRQLFVKKKDSNLCQQEKKGAGLRKVKEEKKKGEIEDKIERTPKVIDITNSPPKREKDSSMPMDVSIQKLSHPLAAKASRIIRRHSSSSSFSSRSSSPVGLNNKGRRGSSGKSSPKEISCMSLDSKDLRQLTVNLQPFSPLQGTLDSGRLSCVSRCSSSRKVVAVPKMSAAVRLKLNSEMSKNFQKGLNVENVKNVSANMTPSKGKRSLAHSKQTLKFNSGVNIKLQPKSQTTKDIKMKLLSHVSDIEISPSVEIIQDSQTHSHSSSSPVVLSNTGSSGVISPPSIKGSEIINDGELAVCVKKLQGRKDVSITAINENGEKTTEFGNTILSDRPPLPKNSPEVYCAASVITRPSVSSPGLMVEVVPKLKKFKNPKASFMKNVMGKEHRIVGLPLSPIASYNSVMKSLENVAQKHKKKANAKMGKPLDTKESFRQRSSGRQNAGTYNYKEISLRRYENFVQLILTPGSTKMKNSLNVQVLHEFRDALQQLRRDEYCRVVLVTSTGSSFCQGVDLHSLLHTNIERRKKAAQELSDALKEFLRVLAMFNKPIVAGVHGATVGLGVTMLPFFDVVYASDKATFHAPYARLGQIPEGAAVLTLPLMLGNAVTSELLFGSRKLTASEALHYGLVTRVLWPDTFQEELIPNIKAMASQSSQSMQAMKALLRLNLRVKLEATLDSESSLLVQHWCSPECQRNFRKFLETSDEVFLQRQKKDPCYFNS